MARSPGEQSGVSSGSLTVVGTGIEVGSHLTQAAREEIEAQAERVPT